MRWYIFILLIFILIIGYISYPTITGYIVKDEKYGFEDALKEIKEIEEQFNFKEGYPESLDDKWAMLGKLNNIKNYVENLPKDEEINALYDYMFFRTKEIESKIKFQLASMYKLNIMDDGTLICPKKELFTMRMTRFNESINFGYEAIDYLNKFIKYPKYLKMTKLTMSLPKLMEAQYYKIEEDRKEEEETVMELCFS